MKLLFGVDMTETRSVTQQVVELAERLQAELLVLHVMTAADIAERAALVPMIGFNMPKNPKDAERDELLAFERFVLERFPRRIKAGIRHGDPATNIIKEAEIQDVDMIVLGHQHHSALERLIIGSVAHEVAEKAHRMLVFVPVPEEEE